MRNLGKSITQSLLRHRNVSSRSSLRFFRAEAEPNPMTEPREAMDYDVLMVQNQSFQ